MITPKEMMTEYAKCYSDKTRMYFIQHYLSTMTSDGMKPLELFPRQKAFIQSLTDNRESIAIKHRQAGITTITSAWGCGQIVFASKEAPETILCIGNKLDLAQQLVEKIRAFLEQVPRWMWGNDFWSPDPKSEKNKKDIFVKCSKSELELFNGCKVYARSSGPNSARGISSVSVLVFDEAAFIENGPSVYASAVAATSARPNRKIVMISTPNGKDALYYNTYKQAQTKENNYNAVEFKWFQDLRYNKFLKWYKKNEKTGELDWIEEKVLDKTGTVPYDEERWRNLERQGYTPTSPWYISMCKAFNNDSMMIAQELDGSFMGSSNNVVAPEYIEMQQKLNVREPLTDMKDPMVDETWFWKPPIEGHRYICSCLPEGEKVRTQRGLINVQDVQETDKLITKDGKFVNIVHKMCRKVENEKIVTFRPSNTCRKTTFTWNHPILSSIDTPLKRIHGGNRYWKFDFKKNNAENVNIKDWLVVPNIYNSKELTEKEILEKWEKYETIIRIDFRIPCPLLDEEFWWYCGMWLAEGYFKDNTSLITAHYVNETDYIQKIEQLSQRLFGRKCGMILNEENNCTNVYFGSKQLVSFMFDNFGKYAKNKHIAEWIKFLPKKYKIQLIKGYNQGDGFINSKQKYSGFTSVSLKLLEDVQDILFSLGIISSIKLHVKEGTVIRFPNRDNVSICSNKYELTLGMFDTKLLMELFGIENNIELKHKRIINEIFFSDDLSKIYIRVAEKEEKLYTGLVYNFWVDDETHTYTCMNITCGNCDPSRGTSEDRTAIEIIDMDGRDENGMPIIEQVAEYLGKKLGDDIGGMLYQYATMYNNAIIIIDATGGQGDAAILTLIQMGYKNFYYEDNTQKTYMVQNSTKTVGPAVTDKLPGFHFQGNRFPVLSNFASMVRMNEIKIRSMRVINELETWIFKGEVQRIDHMDGAHDDTLTCIAMAMFVLNYSLRKLDETKSKDTKILQSYFVNGGIGNKPTHYQDGQSMSPKKFTLPFYNGKNVNKYGSHIQGTHLWVFGMMK